jgi:hypothetical protein
MRRSQQVSLWLSISILGALTLSPASMGQASPGSQAAAPAIEDWTYHHVIFSKPATAEQARRLEQDPRYRQQMRRESPSAPEAETPRVVAPEFQAHTHGDTDNAGLWSEDLGTGATIGAGNYPAKYSFNGSTASCTSDFVVFPTGLAGAAGPTGQATIVAYNNLYTTGCTTGTVPSVYWAYNTGTGSTIQSSPVFSRDGAQLAFVQENAGAASVVLVKWKASITETIADPGTPGTPHGPYISCVSPCKFTIALEHGVVSDSDTNSSIFYDYDTDTAYVGDDSGWLHMFNPVFLGPGDPAEVTTDWPVQVNPGAPTALTSPTYDSVSGNVFVADKGGFLYAVNSTGGVTISGHLDVSNGDDAGPGIVQGPIVDSTAGLVYVFATSDGKGDCAGGLDCSAVYAASTTFTAGDNPPHAKVGTSTAHGTAPSPMYIGAFDSTYENSTNATGNIYVCGNTGGKPTLYQVPVTAGTFGAVNTVTALSGATTPCSPVTHIVNASASPAPAELVFASVHASGTSAACAAGGCMYSSKVAQWQPNTLYAAGQEILDTHFQTQVVETGGTSGATVPTWSITVGGTTTGDGGVTWLDQGVVATTIAEPDWEPTTTYSVGNVIVDSNNQIEICITTIGSGKSGGTRPAWKTVPGQTTTEPNVHWENLGISGIAALAAAGGTSGIIVDNTVATGTEKGASQVYFTTLGSQTCTTSGGTGGCAVQASQSALR